MDRYAIIALATASLALAACGTTATCGKPEPYLDARPGQLLSIPDGLDRPPVDRLSSIPEGADTVHTELRGPYVDWPDGTTTCLIEPPPMRPVRL